MTAVIVRADARCLPLADASVDLIVTSPPYFALRSYQDDGQHYDGQIGSEDSPSAFVDALVECTQEWLRVLKPAGSLWINLGDKYATSVGQGNATPGKTSSLNGRDRLVRAYDVTDGKRSGATAGGVRAKSLIGVPWRYALACIDQLGLVLRAEVIWSKPNGLPESVTDRVRRDHEQWFHFTTRGRYYSAVDELRDPFRSGTTWIGRDVQERVNTDRRDGGKACVSGNHLGRLPGSVWTIASEPLKVPATLEVDHFAAFPLEFPLRIIRGWAPVAICSTCGEGLKPLVRREERDIDPALRHLEWERAKQRYDGVTMPTRTSTLKQTDRVTRTITGYVCRCGEPAQTRPAVVLDPFGGTGTTALAASVLGRLGVSVDLSGDYCRLARWRTTDPAERARAMRVEKPPIQVNGQGSLFGEAS